MDRMPAVGVPLLYVLTLTQVLKLPRLDPHYRVVDFFHALLGNPVRGTTDAAASEVPTPGEPSAAGADAGHA